MAYYTLNNLSLSRAFYKVLNTLGVNWTRLSVVSTRNEKLAEYVRAARAALGNPSYREIAQRSGGLISHSTVAMIVNGTAGELTVNTLRGLAKALRKSEDEIFAIARGVKTPQSWTETRFFELYEAYQGLQEERHKRKVAEDIQDLLTIINAFPQKKSENDQGGNIRNSR